MGDFVVSQIYRSSTFVLVGPWRRFVSYKLIISNWFSFFKVSSSSRQASNVLALQTYGKPTFCELASVLTGKFLICKDPEGRLYRQLESTFNCEFLLFMLQALLSRNARLPVTIVKYGGSGKILSCLTMSENALNWMHTYFL